MIKRFLDSSVPQSCMFIAAALTTLFREFSAAALAMVWVIYFEVRKQEEKTTYEWSRKWLFNST